MPTLVSVFQVPKNRPITIIYDVSLEANLVGVGGDLICSSSFNPSSTDNPNYNNFFIYTLRINELLDI